MKRIGVLGGTFNPVHIGHLAIAESVCDDLKLKELLFVPCYYPPHKTKKSVIASKHRLNMLHLAIADNSKFRICEDEIKRKGKSYSIDTLEGLVKRYPVKTAFDFIIGADMLTGLKNWRRIDDLAKLVRFVVVGRGGYAKKDIVYRHKIVPAHNLNISSSYLRRCLRLRKSVKYLLPEKVYAYIKRHKLYL